MKKHVVKLWHVCNVSIVGVFGFACSIGLNVPPEIEEIDNEIVEQAQTTLDELTQTTASSEVASRDDVAQFEEYAKQVFDDVPSCAPSEDHACRKSLLDDFCRGYTTVTQKQTPMFFNMVPDDKKSLTTACFVGKTTNDSWKKLADRFEDRGYENPSEILFNENSSECWPGYVCNMSGRLAGLKLMMGRLQEMEATCLDLCAGVTCAANASCRDGKCECKQGYQSEDPATTTCTKIGDSPEEPNEYDRTCLKWQYQAFAEGGCEHVHKDEPVDSVRCDVVEQSLYCDKRDELIDLIQSKLDSGELNGNGTRITDGHVLIGYCERDENRHFRRAYFYAYEQIAASKIVSARKNCNKENGIWTTL